MLTLNVGLSRKVGEPDYGSRGASVHLELEVEGNLAGDPEALHEKIRRLFALARQSVDEELSAQRATPSHDQPAAGKSPSRNGDRKATVSQQSAIRAICERLDQDPEGVSHAKFGTTLSELSLRQASSLIDELKAQANGVGAGRSR